MAHRTLWFSSDDTASVQTLTSGSVFSKKNNKITNGSTRINVDKMKPIIHEVLKEKVSEMPWRIVTDVLSNIPVKNSI